MVQAPDGLGSRLVLSGVWACISYQRWYPHESGTRLFVYKITGTSNGAKQHQNAVQHVGALASADMKACRGGGRGADGSFDDKKPSRSWR